MTEAQPGNAPVGLLGGAFDPLHIGHLRLAFEIRDALNLACVRLIPVNTPNHRTQPQATPQQRVAMLNAVADDCVLINDTREIDRGGVSYTIDTLRSVRDEFDDASLCLILGYDAFLGLPQWHQWEALIELCHIVVATRPGYQPTNQAELIDLIERYQTDDPASLRTDRSGRLFFQTIPLLPISSTDLRERLKEGRSVRFLVPDVVNEIIERDRIYRGCR